MIWRWPSTPVTMLDVVAMMLTRLHFTYDIVKIFSGIATRLA